ncbi:MAG: sigma-E processing peptidase SpoIIGA [Defluviitaleaceae bacterium]|nr:sigma-E processing peptidase SpoIIGA [Defluviitaleaceae bacterium]
MTGRLCSRASKRYRAAFGASFAAALYVLFIVFGSGGVFGVLTGAMGILGGVAITFFPLKRRQFGTLALGAYVLTIAMGGGCLAAYYMITSQYGNGVTLWLLAGSAAVSYILLRQVISRVKRGTMKKAVFAEVRVRMGNAETAFTALVDTGHSLYEPISGKPVVVAEYAALKPLFPQDLCALFETTNCEDSENAANAFVSAGFASRFRLVPYHSVGKRGGLLTGFRPDEVMIGGVPRDVIIAVYNGLLSLDGDSEGEKRALISPELTEVG